MLLGFRARGHRFHSTKRHDLCPYVFEQGHLTLPPSSKQTQPGNNLEITLLRCCFEQGGDAK